MFSRSLLSLLLLALVVLIYPIITATAQSTSSHLFLPIVEANANQQQDEQSPVQPPVANPRPFNVDAKDIVIHSGDVPEDFEYETAEAIMPPENSESIGFANGYSTILLNEDVMFEDPVVIASTAVVFMSTEHAKTNFQAWTEGIAEESDVARISVSTYGDETEAFVQNVQMFIFPAEYFYILVRIGNVNFMSAVGGLASETRLRHAEAYAQTILRKIESARNAGELLNGPTRGITSQKSEWALNIIDTLQLTSVQQ